MSYAIEQIIAAFEDTDEIQIGEKLNSYFYSPDILVHSYATHDNKLVHLLEIDFVDNISSIVKILSDLLDRKVTLKKLRQPMTQFEDSEPFKAADFYTIPKDAKQILQYAHSGGITAPYYFTFISLGERTDKIKLLP